MKRNDLHALTLTAMMIPVIAVAAQLALPIASVPMTLQTFAVCFAGLMLGPMRGVAAVAVYLLMGAIGIPVFAGFTGSLAAVVGPTGGFLVGFLPLVLLAGLAKIHYELNHCHKHDTDRGNAHHGNQNVQNCLHVFLSFS